MDWNWAISIFYKLASIGSGTFIVYLGYRLFIKGVYGETGEVSVDWNDNRLMLKRAAPGSIFAVFGAIVIGLIVTTEAKYSPAEGISMSNIFNLSQMENAKKISELIESEELDAKTKAVLSEILESMGGKPTIIVDNPRTNLDDSYES
ncbi:hypothetical protein HBA55_32545 [Pseudomaricurvus alkylphenolicus]|uniref:hypothetical protein n=1 Tax=Pseudomaricurvus alkylphenolicus TaxID=1306991 RepID=UPI00141D948B|nr:hypothetical protein [Pseudomaricurvus alkylphenolicus]NIB44369.1 hypothetical protein [Pseudomaricurvus alkylphenolicus]